MADIHFVGSLGNGWFQSDSIDPGNGDPPYTVTNWDNNSFPSTIHNVFIDNATTSTGTGVILDGNSSIGALDIGTLSGLTITSQGLLSVNIDIVLEHDTDHGATLTLSDGGVRLDAAIFDSSVHTLENANSITVAGNSSIAFNAFETNLTGGGDLALNGGAAELTGGDGDDVHTLHNIDNTISGRGRIGDGLYDEDSYNTLGAHLLLDNQAAGVVDADNVNGLYMSAVTTNAGILEATGGGILYLQANVTQSGAGAIKAVGSGSQVYVSAGVTGGLLNTSSGGTIHSTGSAGFFDSTTGAGQVHNSGAFVVDAGTTFTLAGTIVNAGSMTLAATGANAVLKISAAGTTLTGGGKIVLAPTTDDNASFLTGVNFSTTPVLHNVNNTISGSGHIGDSIQVDGTLEFDNQAAGIISANTARSLTIEGITLDNAGKVQSTSTGGLVTQDLVLRQAGAGVFQAAGANATATIKDTSVFSGAVKASGTNASVMLENSVFEGVTFSTSSGGKFYVVQDGDLFPGDPPWVTTFDGSSDKGAIHNAGIVEVTDGSFLELDGSIVNTGTLNVHSMSQEATMVIGSAGATLTGSGKLLLSTDSHSSTQPVVRGTSTATNTTLHNASTISGAGTLGSDSAFSSDDHFLLTIDNQAAGIINGNNADAALVIDTTVSNKGLLKADGGSLTVNGAVTGAGHAEVTHGGHLRFDGTFNQDVSFLGANAGNLQVNLIAQTAYAGDISGFMQGDTVTLHGKSFFALADSNPFVWKENAQHTAGTLSITLQSQPGPVVLHLDGYYTTDAFKMTADVSNTLVVNVADTFYEGTAGVDHLTGKNGKNDTFVGLAGKDVINGGTGSDTVLYGEKTAAVSVTLKDTGAAVVTVGGLAEDSITNIENIVGGSGNDKLTGDTVANTLDGGAGNDTLVGGMGKDVLLGSAGDDTVRDTGALIVAGDKIDGGAGADKIVFDAKYTGADALVLNATTVVGVETFVFTSGFNYAVTTANQTVASGKVLTIDASGLDATHKLTFDGSAETNGSFVITGGKDGDQLTGGSKADTFVYSNANQSTSANYDTVSGFKFGTDKFDVGGTISKIDTAVTGKVTAAHFDDDLGARASGLGAHHAMLVTANASSGGLSGDVFLVVDLNGKVGYQEGHDLVIHMDASHGALAKGDFI